MTVQNPAVFLQSEAHPAEDVRRMFGAMAGASGGIVAASDLEVTETSGAPTMGVDVAGGQVWIPGTEATYQGIYFAENRGVETLTIGASDPTNGRYDLIVAKIEDSAYSGSVNAWSLVVVAGTADPSPVDPATPANSITLARVTVGAGVSTITDANITDLRNVVGLEARVADLETPPVDTKTASYTLVAADKNSRVVMNSASATTITVDDGVFSAGDSVWIHNIGAGTCTVTAGTATVDTSASLDVGQWEGGSLYFTSASSAIFFRGGGGTNTLSVDYIVVSGGASGGNAQYSAGGTGRNGGGGGAGGMISGTTTFAYDTNHTVVVGAGAGSGFSGGSVNNAGGVNGSPSIIGTLTALGGGAGAGGTLSGEQVGGSGGGGGWNNGTAGAGAAGTAGQGNAGGSGASKDGGGGGGKGAAGTSTAGGAGDYVAWLTDAIGSTLGVGESSGGNRYFAGGGAGGRGASSTRRSGGVGGGGDGGALAATGASSGLAGAANTGGGGGGGVCDDSANQAFGGHGGSGVVVIRYLTADGTLTVGAGLTYTTTTDGSYTYVAIKSGADAISWEA